MFLTSEPVTLLGCLIQCFCRDGVVLIIAFHISSYFLRSQELADCRRRCSASDAQVDSSTGSGRPSTVSMSLNLEPTRDREIDQVPLVAVPDLDSTGEP